MDDTLFRDVEQFLYFEARLLDERRFHEWLELLTDDVRYWMPVRTARYAKHSKSVVILDDETYDDTELAQQDEAAYLDEDEASLQMRIARLDTGMAWAEDPPSRTRHFITNIEVTAGEAATELRVGCNVMVYRSRGGTEQDFFVGRREDVLRRINGSWKIACRTIVLDQNVLLAKNISIFF